jgi:hypothetical protein
MITDVCPSGTRPRPPLAPNVGSSRKRRGETGSTRQPKAASLARRRSVASGRSPSRCHSIESISTTSIVSGQHASGVNQRSSVPGKGRFHCASGSTLLRRTRSRTSHSGAERQPAMTSASARRGSALSAEGPSCNSRARSSGVARPRWTASHRTARTSLRLLSARATPTAAWPGGTSGSEARRHERGSRIVVWTRTNTAD